MHLGQAESGPALQQHCWRHCDRAPDRVEARHGGRFVEAFFLPDSEAHASLQLHRMPAFVVASETEKFFRAEPLDYLAQSNLRRATSTCADPLAQSNLLRAICTEASILGVVCFQSGTVAWA